MSKGEFWLTKAVGGFKVFVHGKERHDFNTVYRVQRGEIERGIEFLDMTYDDMCSVRVEYTS